MGTILLRDVIEIKGPFLRILKNILFILNMSMLWKALFQFCMYHKIYIYIHYAHNIYSLYSAILSIYLSTGQYLSDIETQKNKRKKTYPKTDLKWL